MTGSSDDETAGPAGQDTESPAASDGEPADADADTETPRILELPDRRLAIPPDATAQEAAAIAVAISTSLRDDAAEDDEAEAETWDGRRFAFAGRVESLTGRQVRVPEGAPTDGWTAIGRLDRL